MEEDIEMTKTTVEIDTTGEDAWRRCGQGAPDGVIRVDEPAAHALATWIATAEAAGRLRLDTPEGRR